MIDKMYGLSGAADLDDVRDALSEKLQPGTCRPVALFYGQPTARVMRELIIPRLEYYHHRSLEFAELFCLGFVSFDGEYYIPTSDEACDMFDQRAFASAVRELEKHSSWRYRGQTDLVLLTAYRAPKSTEASLDFTTVISFCLESAEKTGAVNSAAEFLENFLQFAETYTGDKFVWDFSDHLGLREAGSALKKACFRILPKPFEESAQHAVYFHVKDFSALEVSTLALRCAKIDDSEIRELYETELAERIIRAKQRILSE